MGEGEEDAEAEMDRKEAEVGIGMGWLGAVLIESEKEGGAVAEGSGEAGMAGRESAGAGTTTGAEFNDVEDGRRGECTEGVAGADSEDWASAAVRALVDGRVAATLALSLVALGAEVVCARVAKEAAASRTRHWKSRGGRGGSRLRGGVTHPQQDSQCLCRRE